LEQLVLKENELMMVSDEMGDVPEGRRRLGLYYRDMRYLSIFGLAINGQKPRLLGSSSELNYAGVVQMANPTIELTDGRAALARTISIRRVRYLKDGLHETISFYNHNPFPVPLELTLTFGSDFCDMFEVRGLERAERGTVSPPLSSNSRLTLNYSGLDEVKRCTEIIFDPQPSKVEIEEAPLQVRVRRPSTFLPEATDSATMTLFHPPCAEVRWNLTLKPRTPFSITLHILGTEGEPLPEISLFDEGLSQLRESYDDWLSQCTKLETNHELFNQLLKRSAMDLRLLMEQTPQGAVPTAGIPWFACVFGRDSLLTSLQTLMLNPEIAKSTLRYLAKYQGTEVNPWRDEEPGKIVHEIRKGELSNLKQIPHAAYYGSVDATPLFLMLFAEVMKWLDDDEFYQELLPAVKRALQWMEQYGDIDGDGYIEYLSHSPGGPAEQGWKDSRGSLTCADGSAVKPPVALVEVQGYAYRAMSELSELLARRGEKALAGKLRRRAAALKANFNRDFWLEEQRFFAQALDGDKKPVKMVSSNPGHCLYCGIVDEDKARYAINRLSSAEMACGWGIRTASSHSPNFNPMSYHCGSIWPHDNSIIIAGMKRYGYHWEVEELVSQLFQASQFFPYSRFPELYSGFARYHEAPSIPVQYPVSCSPQAWAAGSSFLLLQAMLGFQADAAARRLYLSPRLPSWLESVSVGELRLGEGTVGLRFERRGKVTNFEIVENSAGVEVIIPAR
jgi:glycogen debranching enzyme